MTACLDLLVIHPWLDAEWRLQLGWLRGLSQAISEPRPKGVGGALHVARPRMDTFAFAPARGAARQSVSQMIDAGRILAQTLREAFYRRAAPTHVLCLEANIDTLVALGEILEGFPVRDSVFVIDLALDGWLAATSPFGLEVVAHLTDVLNRGGASALLFAFRNAALEDLGRSADLPLIRLPDLPLTARVGRSPPPSSALLKEPFAVAVRSLAHTLCLYFGGFLDPVRFAVLVEAVARVYDFPIQWRHELAAAEDFLLTLVELDPAPTPAFDSIPKLVQCLSSLGLAIRDGSRREAYCAEEFHPEGSTP